MVDFTEQERKTLTWLGALLVLGAGTLLWQRQQPPFRIRRSASVAPPDSVPDQPPPGDGSTSHAIRYGRQRESARREPVESTTWDQALRHARGVDVNTAGIAELERLPGVGPTLAKRIVAYRDRHGPFHRAEELSQVPGIGPKTCDALADYLTVR
ncbi:MAG: helix-hairpin-helix domain-containing protein [Candidatus Omnitrophica bacterium]|nr:helix-hairpin-helix domain-containing protein [Candidatus Omnitrophota bacterium]